MDKNQKIKFTSTRKFKYGAIATAFTAFFIAAVILLNVIVSAIDSKWSLYFDMTEESLFTISDSSYDSVKAQLEEYRALTGQEFTITITFLRAEDILLENQQHSWVVNLAESYAESFPEIRVEFREDLLTHPENYSFYTDRGYEVKSTSVLIAGSLNKASFAIQDLESFLVYDENGSNVWAFKGEMVFNAAILSITSQEQPVVAFTTGHQESKPEDLISIFINCGFKVKDIDLATEEIPSEVKLLVISNPQKDFHTDLNDEVVTEYTRLSDYLNDYRSLLFIASPSMPVLPVLDELLADWGMRVERNQIVLDDVSSVPGSSAMLYVEYPESDSVAKALTDTITGNTSPARTVSYMTAPITILDPGDGQVESVEAVLTSSANAYVEIAEEGKITKQFGPFDLMAVSSRYTIENNTDVYGHIALIGSAHFTETNAYLSSYGNTEIIYNMIRLLTNEKVQMKTFYKVIEDYEISAETGEIYVYGVITALALPLCVFVLGTVVYIKRKHL